MTRSTRLAVGLLAAFGLYLGWHLWSACERHRLPACHEAPR